MHADTGAKHLKGKPKRKLRCSSLPFSSKIPEKRGKVVGREQKQKNKARICLHRLQEYRHSIKRPHHIAYIPTSCCVGADQLVEISDSDLEEMEDWVSTNMEVIVRSTPTHHTHTRMSAVCFPLFERYTISCCNRSAWEQINFING